MQRFILLLTVFLVNSCQTVKSSFNQHEEKTKINSVLNLWHKAAATTNFDAYFSKMTSDAIFIGTDASENWDMASFKRFSKPYFDKGKAWSFTPLERHIFFNGDSTIAWFDELLDTQMELCRGSGVLELTNQGWKIKHYVLSIAIPNENVKQVVKDKKKNDILFKESINKNSDLMGF